MIGWLCPALFHYFDAAPEHIFVRLTPLPAGIDPVWHIDRDSPEARRYMSVEDRQ